MSEVRSVKCASGRRNLVAGPASRPSRARDSKGLIIDSLGAEKLDQGVLVVTVEEVETVPQENNAARIEYSRPGYVGLREQFVVEGEKLTITQFGAVGEVVEGSLGPLQIEEKNGKKTPLSIRFHVCRVPDWHMRP